jgi:hypothetical protein
MTTMTDVNVLPLDGIGPTPTPAPEPPAAPTALDPVDTLARNPATALDQIDRQADPAALARGWVVTILVCAGAFGATLGFFRGAQQAVYAAVKLPLVILLTAAVLAPALTCLNAALRRPADLRKDLLLVLACLARASLVLSAEIPILWLGLSLDASYHTMVLAAVAACAVAGAAALWLLVRGLLRFRRGAIVTAVLLVSAFMVVGAQMTWVLRPYLARPRDADPPFLRALDGSFVESVVTSADSARGIYRSPAGVGR